MSNIENSTFREDNTIENPLSFFKDKCITLEQKVEVQEAKIKYYEEQFRLNQAKKLVERIIHADELDVLLTWSKSIPVDFQVSN
jgi:hypothetical protein